LLRVLARCDAMELLYSSAIRALQTFGTAAVEQVLEAETSSSSSPPSRTSVGRSPRARRRRPERIGPGAAWFARCWGPSGGPGAIRPAGGRHRWTQTGESRSSAR
jgi:hypothetical protein